MPQLVSQQPPPPDYYAANLRQLLAEVRLRCRALLSGDEARFIHACLSASAPAQRLFARLLSRRGPWLRVDSLNYPEVEDCERALAELAAARLVSRDPGAPADALLNLFTRDELSALFPRVKGRSKSAWILACVGRYPDAAIRRRLRQRAGWLCVEPWQAYSVCRLLYFGDDRQDLSAFVVQDLGILRYEPYELGPHTRPFDCRQQVERYLGLRGLAIRSRQLSVMPELAPRLLTGLWSRPDTRMERRLRDKLLLRLARWHERRGELDAALQCYGRAMAHPARERRARILRRLGDEQSVNGLISEIVAAPWSAEEEGFARRFARRRGAPHRRRTEGLVSTLCTLPGPTPAAIEGHAIRLLAANVGAGWHLENRFPLGLAGLLYWDEVYAPVKGAFTHAFQLGPQDLFWADFAPSRRTLLESRTESLREPGAVAARLREVWTNKAGTANPLVSWQAFNLGLIQALDQHVPQEALLRLAACAIENLYRLRTGFPDLLMVYGPGAYEFVEVKGPTDQLQPAQRTWLRVLGDLDLPARVLKFQS